MEIRVGESKRKFSGGFDVGFVNDELEFFFGIITRIKEECNERTES